MKRMNFLAKLQKQKKLQIVEPNKRISQAYLQKSDKTINSSKATFEIESYEDSIALSYYSMYYSVLSLLFRIGIKCENHTAAIILLKEIFDIDNKILFDAKKERTDKQYYVDFSVTKENTQETISEAERFNSQLLEFIDNLNQDKIKKYKEKSIRLLQNTKNT